MKKFFEIPTINLVEISTVVTGDGDTPEPHGSAVIDPDLD